VISSDVIRRTAMEEYMRNDPRGDLEKAFEKTAKTAKQRFTRGLAESLRSTADTSIVFLDKNHPTNSIRGLFEDLHSLPRKRKVIVVGLVPCCSEPLRTLQGTYPFSPHLLIQCLLRVKERQDHLTLEGGLDKRAGVVCRFFQLFRGCSFETLASEGFHHMIAVPFTDETRQDYPPEVLNALGSVLEQTTERTLPRLREVQDLYRMLETVTYAEVNPAESFVTQLEQLIGLSSLPRHSEETKAPSKQTTPKRPSKPPLYLAIDLEPSLGRDLVSLIKRALRRLIDSRLVSQGAAMELRALLDYEGATQFASGRSLVGGWAFPSSLHLTVVFLGGAYSKADRLYYEGFNEGEEHVVELTHLVYVPTQLISLSARLPSQGLPVKSRKPHVTCLLNRAKAKMSNIFLEALSSTLDEIDRAAVSIERKKYEVYVVPLESCQFPGHTASFYS
jgi:hypothetical protein